MQTNFLANYNKRTGEYNNYSLESNTPKISTGPSNSRPWSLKSRPPVISSMIAQPQRLQKKNSGTRPDLRKMTKFRSNSSLSLLPL